MPPPPKPTSTTTKTHFLPIPHQNQPYDREQPPNPTFCLTHLKTHPPLWGLWKIMTMRKKKKKTHDKQNAGPRQAHPRWQPRNDPAKETQNTTEKLTVGLISSDPKSHNKSPLRMPSRCLPSNPISSKPNHHSQPTYPKSNPPTTPPPHTPQQPPKKKSNPKKEQAPKPLGTMLERLLVERSSSMRLE